MTDGDGVVLGVAVATALVFGSTVALGSPALGALLALAVLIWSGVRYAPNARLRTVGIGAATAGVAGAVIPVVVFESDWTADLSTGTPLTFAALGAVVVYWFGVEAIRVGTAEGGRA